jgi:DNA-binding NarL/FixJ family response regulator
MFWLSYGYCDKDIALLLNLSNFTVRNHVLESLRRTGFTTRLQLGLYAYHTRVARETKKRQRLQSTGGNTNADSS